MVVLAPLVDHPGRWARVCVTARKARAHELAHELRRSPDRYPPGQWEFTARSLNDGGAVFARFLGR